MSTRTRNLINLFAVSAFLIAVTGVARAQYFQLWSIVSNQGPDAATFDLGDETNELLFPMTQNGSQGEWPGGPAHSARALARPGVLGIHSNQVLPYQAHTVYGDTDGDGVMEFVSDNILLRQLIVWDGATGVIESRIPYPPGATQFLYVLLLDVNANNGQGTCEIIGHWLSTPVLTYGTTCWGLAGGAAAPEPSTEKFGSLQQNSPNPFGQTTEIHYSLASSGEVSMVVFDAQGRQIRALPQGRQDPGEHVVTWDRRSDAGDVVAAGVYFYQMQEGATRHSRKAIVLD
jgi:hypothetical protein